METPSGDALHQHAKKLRPQRRKLVLAAENVIKSAFELRSMQIPKNTQFSNLVGLCGEAACAEEITNYLRYQAGRRSREIGWELDFVNTVIEGIQPIIDSIDDDPALHAAAWRLYAAYLARAHRYHDTIRRNNDSRKRTNDSRKSARGR